MNDHLHPLFRGILNGFAEPADEEFLAAQQATRRMFEQLAQLAPAPHPALSEDKASQP